MRFWTRLVLIFMIILGAFAASADSPKKVLILGDSLAEGYGVAKTDSFPSILEKLLSVPITNGGSSGSTSASGVARLKWYLRNKPDIMILELGANDGLRGLKPEETEKNLREAIDLAKAQGITVVLAGMKAPPNYGKDYTRDFDRIFPALAKSENITLIPFLLIGVAGDPSLNQADGIHPNEKGHAIVAKTIAHYLKPLL